MARVLRADLAVPLLLIGASSCALLDRGGRAVTPQRPTFSSDTSTTAPGTREVEGGLTTTDGGGYDTPLTFKYGADERSEIFAGISPYVRAEGLRASDEGVGDLVLGFRRRLASRPSDDATMAWLVALKLPADDEADGVTSGEVDAFAAGIWSETRGDSSVTAQYQLGVVGVPGGGGADLQHGLALAFGRPLGPGVGGFVEVAGVLTPERDDEPVFATLGLTHSPDPWLVLDVFASVGLNEDAADLRLGLGFTHNFGGF